MFRSFGRTWELAKLSWGVLREDRKLVLFPIFSGVALLILAGLLSGVGQGLGTFERLGAEQPQPTGSDIALLAIAYFLLAFVIIYFNSALIGAAMEVWSKASLEMPCGTTRRRSRSMGRSRAMMSALCSLGVTTPAARRTPSFAIQNMRRVRKSS